MGWGEREGRFGKGEGRGGRKGGSETERDIDGCCPLSNTKYLRKFHLRRLLGGVEPREKSESEIRSDEREKKRGRCQDAGGDKGWEGSQSEINQLINQWGAEFALGSQ